MFMSVCMQIEVNNIPKDKYIIEIKTILAVDANTFAGEIIVVFHINI